jgi:hypothetical protein
MVDILTFNTPGLTAIPHRLIVADVYKGYYLPAGSIVIGNTWYVDWIPEIGFLAERRLWWESHP